MVSNTRWMHSVGISLVEQIAHRIDEDELWPPPVQGLFQARGPKRQIETGLKRMSLDAAKTLG